MRPESPPAEDLWSEAEALQRDVRIRLVIIAANVAGAALVALEAVVVGLPASSFNAPSFVRNNVLPAVVLVVYLALAVLVEDGLNRRRLERSFGWIGQRREPEPAEVGEVFDYPWVLARRILAWWLGGSALFLGLNLGFGNDVAYSLRTALGIALGGLTSSAVSFLLLERYNRPIFALALAGEATGRGGRIGLQRRLLLTWALGAGVPVIVIVAAPAGLSASQRAGLAVPVLIVGAIALAVGFGLTMIASRSVVDPIHVLRRSQRQVEDGDLTVEVRVDDGGEVGLLQAGFNRMVTALAERQRIRDLFGRHVGLEVARLALSDESAMGGELRDASVLFVDLIGSTGMAQSLAPHEVVDLLNLFFSAVVRCAGEEGGWVNKFEGDAALCVFGPPSGHDHHAAAALRTARKLRGEIEALARSHPGFDAGTGISSGSVVAGNIGAEDRYEYTVIGDPVNEAARLSEEAKQTPARVLASGAVVNASGDEGGRWRHCGSRLLRGRDRETELYEPA